MTGILGYGYKISRQVHAAASIIGHSPAAILRQVGLSAHFLDDPDAEVTAEQYLAIWAAVNTLVDEPELAVTLGQKLSQLPFTSALVAFSCADTIRSGLERLTLFKPFIAPVRIEHGKAPGGYRVRFLPLTPELQFNQLLANFELSHFVELCRLLTGKPVIPRSAGTLEPLPALDAFLGCRTRRMAHPELLFRHADIDLPLIAENTDVWQGLKPILKQQMQAFEQRLSLADRVRSELMELLPSGRASIEDVCTRLNLGRRSLQRQLSAEGTNFRSVLDELRKALALSYLHDDTLRIEEIAYLLAFTDPNSFYRAFRSWTSMTPGDARNLNNVV